MLASYKQIVPPPTQQQILILSGLPRLKNCSWYSLERSSGSWYKRGITTKCSTSSHLRHLRQEMGWCKEISISRFLRSSFSFTVFLWWGLIFARSFGSVICVILVTSEFFPHNLQPKVDWGYDSFTTSWNRLPLLAARARHEQLSALPLLQKHRNLFGVFGRLAIGWIRKCDQNATSSTALESITRSLQCMDWYSSQQLGWDLGKSKSTGWWFQIFFVFTPIWERFPFWPIIFQMGWKPPTNQQVHVCFFSTWWLLSKILSR